MKKSKNKNLMLIILLTVCLTVCMVFAACGGVDDNDGDNNGGGGGGSIVGEEPFVKSVQIISNPSKTEYVETEIFDPSGLVFNAVWDIDGEEETIEMNASDCDSFTLSNKPLTVEDEEVVFTIGGFDFAVKITVTKSENRVLFDDSFDNYTDGWTITENTANTTVTQNDSSVTVRKTNTQAHGYMTRKNFTAPTGAFIYSFKTKINSSLESTRSVAEFSVRASAYLIRLVLLYNDADPTQGVVQDDYQSPAKTFVLDTSEWHDYKVVVNASYSYDLYVDGIMVWSGAAKKSQTGANILKIGADNASNFPASGVADFDLDYFKLETGVLIEDTE